MPLNDARVPKGDLPKPARARRRAACGDAGVGDLRCHGPHVLRRRVRDVGAGFLAFNSRDEKTMKSVLAWYYLLLEKQRQTSAHSSAAVKGGGLLLGANRRGRA